MKELKIDGPQRVNKPTEVAGSMSNEFWQLIRNKVTRLRLPGRKSKETVVKVRQRSGWRGDPEGHARAGRLGGLKAAENRRKNAQN